MWQLTSDTLSSALPTWRSAWLSRQKTCPPKALDQSDKTLDVVPLTARLPTGEVVGTRTDYREVVGPSSLPVAGIGSKKSGKSKRGRKSKESRKARKKAREEDRTKAQEDVEKGAQAGEAKA
ncbi:hypothetical protein Droror1_Dr00024714 [Drosera rotundifolia]